MEQEIDLRPYMTALGQNWMWIIAAAIIGAVLALAVTFFIPPTYEATALVAVTEPRQIVQFDPRITGTDEEIPFDAYPELATSDELLTTMLSEVSASVPEITNLEELRNILSAEAGSDPSLLRLSVRYGDPETAAMIANNWAELFVVKANQVFGSQGDEQLLFFESQLGNAFEELQRSEDALVEFQRGDRSMILENELLALQQTQADQLAKKRQLTFILQDIASLQEQLQQAGQENDLSTTGELTAILLQLRAFSGVTNEETVPPPWQLQVNVDPIAEEEGAVKSDFLENLQEVVLVQAEQIDNHLAELEPVIFDVQERMQAATTEKDRLERNETVAEETYIALARKVQEEQITSQDTNSGIRLASRSAVPAKPESSGRWIIMIIAAVVAASFVMLIIIIRTGRAQNTTSASNQ